MTANNAAKMSMSTHRTRRSIRARRRRLFIPAGWWKFALSARAHSSSARDVEIIVATIFGEITAALCRGDRVELRGFGTNHQLKAMIMDDCSKAASPLQNRCANGRSAERPDKTKRRLARRPWRLFVGEIDLRHGLDPPYAYKRQRLNWMELGPSQIDVVLAFQQTRFALEVVDLDLARQCRLVVRCR